MHAACMLGLAPLSFMGMARVCPDRSALIHSKTQVFVANHDIVGPPALTSKLWHPRS